MPQIKSLQVFRGLAALCVVFFHGSISTNTFVATVPPTAAAVFGKGWLGVDFFFVLSGFIIMYAHARDAQTLPAVRRYAYKRLVRIFPAYLPITIGMLLVHADFFGHVAPGTRDYSLASSLFLVPANLPPILSVAWSLVHELIFYGVFLLFFVSRRLFAIALAAWAVAIVASTLTHEPTDWLRYPLSALNLEFMLGVVAAWVVTKFPGGVNGRPLVASGIAAAVLVVVAMQQFDFAFLRIAFSAALAVMIVGFAIWERTWVFAWPAWLVLLGNASYSIYLIHNPVLSVSQRLSGRFGLDWIAGIAFGVVASLVAGYLYHLAVERRALLFFGARLKRPAAGLEQPR